MKVTKEHVDRLSKLFECYSGGNLCLVSCRRIADDAEVVVACQRVMSGESVLLVPLAEMLSSGDGSKYDPVQAAIVISGMELQ
jgi:hypothetical protein